MNHNQNQTPSVIIMGKALKDYEWDTYVITFTGPRKGGSDTKLTGNDLVFLVNGNGHPVGEWVMVVPDFQGRAHHFDYGIGAQAQAEYKKAVLEGFLDPDPIIDPQLAQSVDEAQMKALEALKDHMEVVEDLDGHDPMDQVDWDWVRRMKASRFSDWDKAIQDMVEFSQNVVKSGGQARTWWGKDEAIFFIQYGGLTWEDHVAQAMTKARIQSGLQ